MKRVKWMQHRIWSQVISAVYLLRSLQVIQWLSLSFLICKIGIIYVQACENLITFVVSCL